MNDEIDELTNGATQSGDSSDVIKRFFRFLGNIFKTIGHFVKFIFGLLGSTWWIILIVLILVIVISVVISFVKFTFNGGYNAETGTMSSLGGIKGDKFYGSRFVYYDEEYTSVDLQNVYLEFTYNILNNIEKASEDDLNINFDKPYLENNQINVIATAFARDLSGTNGTLLECTRIIKYYGFEDENIVLGSIAKCLKTNNYTSLEENIILNKIKDEFDKHFSYMKNVCAKILIKDYILSENDSASNIPKKNYIGFVYMPKEEVIIDSTSFIFKVDEEKTVDIVANYCNNSLNQEITSATADETWFKDDVMDKALECEISNYTLKTFSAIDETNINYLETEKSLFRIYRDGKFNIIFNEFADSSKVETLMNNFNTEGYFYLSLSSDMAYNMVDVGVEY